MQISEQYAQALHELVQKDESKSAQYLTNLRGVLKKRGHESILAQIFTEYKKLEEKVQRMQHYKIITPEQKRTALLLELYRKLVSAN